MFGYSPIAQIKSRETAPELTKLITFNELETLARTARREDFGPGSAHPYLAIDLTDTSSLFVPWIKNLPCPVIGIGDGELAKACDLVLENESKLPRLAQNIEKTPIAAMILVQHLRLSQHLSLHDALTSESFAYATLQKGPEFNDWQSNPKSEPRKKVAAPSPLSIVINDNQLELVMNDEENLNAIGVNMRDALCEALDLAILDSNIKRVSLTGSGRVFSTGGDVTEFGEVADPATAHWIRSLRLPATRLAQLSYRLHIHVNGAAVGAGAEIVGFAKTVTASQNAWFQLPELKYGLIPGAGGTVALTKRIGRQRTAFLALSMRKINAQTALEWGLVDELTS